MTILKTCKYCGNEFIPDKHFRNYCSDECAELGKRLNRKNWMERTHYRDKDKERHRLQRFTERAERDKLQTERRIAVELEQADRLKRLHDEFTAKCEAGDPFCLMLKALNEHGNVTTDYWDAFQQYAISFNDKRIAIVNGISIYDDDFSNKVCDSINTLGMIRIEYKNK